MTKIIIAISPNFNNQNLFNETLSNYIEKLANPTNIEFILPGDLDHRRINIALKFAQLHKIKIVLTTVNNNLENRTKLQNEFIARTGSRCICFNAESKNPFSSLQKECKTFSRPFHYCHAEPLAA